MDNKLILDINKWHENGEYDKIIDTILAIPKEDYDFEVIGELARAYNNVDLYDTAIEWLMSVSEKGTNDSLWNFRLGYSYFYKKDYKKALELFEKSYKLGDFQSLKYIDLCIEELERNKRLPQQDNSMNTIFENTNSRLPHSPLD